MDFKDGIKKMNPYVFEETWPPSNFKRRCIFCRQSALRRPGEDWTFEHSDDCMWLVAQEEE